MITFEEIRKYVNSKKGVTEERPFGPDVLVHKVMGKMFTILPEDEEELSISLKCDPDEALALRDMYTAVQPGYHLNKKHWNTVTIDGSIPNDEIWQMIDNSYDLVVKKTSKKRNVNNYKICNILCSRYNSIRVQNDFKHAFLPKLYQFKFFLDNSGQMF